ncbi:MAG: hypothetical protein RMM17_04645 [Acidobacteriota bacterium]|nr:hypothetical protein [Blastocatellia bacterium]MDW8411952.1 hypothetical protein [Acidobacteriota bacterium]
MKLAYLLGEHFACRNTGTLTVKIDSDLKDIIFKEGEIISVASTNEQESLLPSLLRWKILSTEAVDLIKQLLAEANLELEQILLEMNYTDVNNLASLTERNFQEILFNSFTKTVSEFSFIDSIPTSIRHKFSKPTYLLLTELFDSLGDDWRSLLDDESTPLSLVDNHPTPTEELGLNDDQLLILQCLQRKPMPIKELLELFLPEDIILKTVAKWRAIGLLKLTLNTDTAFELAAQKKSASALYMESQRLLAEGQVEAALDCISKALEISHSDPEFWAQLARCYSKINGKHREAEGAYFEAISRDSSDPTYPYELGQLYLKFNLKKRALEMFKQALAIDPNYMPAKDSMKLLSK